MLTFRQLEAFKAVMDAGSVVRAAETINLSQPAVSRLLSDLERAVGYRLFDRGRGRLRPLDAAGELYFEVERSLHGLDRIADAAERIGQRRSKQLRLAVLPGYANGPLPEVVAAFLDKHQDVFLSLETRTRQQIFDGVADGLHDIGLASMPIDVTDVVVEPLVYTEAACLVPKDHPLSSRDVITPRDLDGVSCILGADRTPLRRQVGKALADAGARPDIRAEVTTAQAGHALVACGVGVCIGWRLMFDYSAADRVQLVKFRPKIEAALAVVYPVGHPPEGVAAEFLRDFARTAEAW